MTAELVGARSTVEIPGVFIGVVFKLPARTSEAFAPARVPTIRPAAVAAVSVLVLIRIHHPKVEIKLRYALSINRVYVTLDTPRMKSAELESV